jgi:hypothetical protein
MKASNLFGLLALGGIGYYFLKNNKEELVSSAPPSTTYVPPTDVETKLVENPYVASADTTSTSATSTDTATTGTTPTSTNPIGTTPTSTNPIVTTPTSANSTATNPTSTTPMISTPETALAPLGLETNCGVPTNGWDFEGNLGWDFKGDLVKSLMVSGYGKEIRYLIFNPEVKQWGQTYIDECGNLYLKSWTNLLKDKSANATKDGFHRGEIQGYSPYDKQTFSYKKIPYYINNKMLYLLPSTLIQNYRNKYLVPLESYLKRLPELSLINTAQPNPIQQNMIFNNYPPNGVWTNPPKINDGIVRKSGYVLTPLELKEGMYYPFNINNFMKTNSMAYSGIYTKFLINNPEARNRGQFYIDQLGNIIEVKTDMNRNVVGQQLSVPAYKIAEYRVDNNIPF